MSDRDTSRDPSAAPAAGAPSAGAPAAGEAQPQAAPPRPPGPPGGYGDRPRYGSRPDGGRPPWRPRDRQGGDEDGGDGGRMGGRDRFKDGGRPRFGRFFKRKVCKFCTRKLSLTYRDADTLRRFITERGKILPRRMFGTCAEHQRKLTLAVNRARNIALLPFMTE